MHGGTAQEKLEELSRQSAGCTRCDLYRDATQTVFGEGSPDASIFFIGEQPGDKEDLAGSPFVGPAGAIFNKCLEEAGIDRTECYVTNAVKHFKFQLRGKRRIHQRPNAGEVQACRWWLEGELELVRPRLIVALGATAANALEPRKYKIMRDRGRIMPFTRVYALLLTVHPSYLLRVRNKADMAAQREQFVGDLRTAAEFVHETSRTPRHAIGTNR
ncbi:UdgX family uracil-DNA binding protein [Phyllobacterium salinisoli]|uniref:UdgX family uracil-DNA binding protein n=1 Tax=Phyllobacterium salinisoli TaxID=1899321 RepID=UPI001FE0905C|nr:UdgX family uracil-DNA binding protein [Phyllobacterium salinisoli]